MKRRITAIVWSISLPAIAQSALALDIPNGDYSKNHPDLVRVLTWNVLQHLGDPGESTTPWTSNQIGSPLSAVNLVIQALDPDIILLQECGDIDSNTSRSQVVAALNTWRNLQRPGFFVVVGNSSGSIQNAIISRWPLSDLNGDGTTSAADLPFISGGPGGWPTGGNGGIRGWVQAEINLPDAVYHGDLYVGSSHFKALSGFDSERIAASRNISAYIQFALNLGNDPLNIIPDSAQPPQPLGVTTPVVWGGDFNAVDSAAPIDILKSNNPASATDGTDRDGGPAWRSDAAAAFNGTTYTHQMGSRLDYIFIQDHIASINATFIFDTGRMPRNSQTLQITQGAPINMAGLLQNSRISAFASDHYPVVTDIELPPPAVLAGINVLGLNSVASGGLAAYQGVAQYSDGSQQIVTQSGIWSVTGPAVIGVNTGHLTAGQVGVDTPATVEFLFTDDGISQSGSKTITIRAVSCSNLGDVNGDGILNGSDIASFTSVLLGVDLDPYRICRSNLDGNTLIDASDITALVAALIP